MKKILISAIFVSAMMLTTAVRAHDNAFRVNVGYGYSPKDQSQLLLGVGFSFAASSTRSNHGGGVGIDYTGSTANAHYFYVTPFYSYQKRGLHINLGMGMGVGYYPHLSTPPYNHTVKVSEGAQWTVITDGYAIGNKYYYTTATYNSDAEFRRSEYFYRSDPFLYILAVESSPSSLIEYQTWNRLFRVDPIRGSTGLGSAENDYFRNSLACGGSAPQNYLEYKVLFTSRSLDNTGTPRKGGFYGVTDLNNTNYFECSSIQIANRDGTPTTPIPPTTPTPPPTEPSPTTPTPTPTPPGGANPVPGPPVTVDPNNPTFSNPPAQNVDVRPGLKNNYLGYIFVPTFTIGYDAHPIMFGTTINAYLPDNLVAMHLWMGVGF